VNVPTGQRVELWLAHIAAGHDYDVYLRNVDLQLVARSDAGGSADEHLRTGTLRAGRYYVQVYNHSKRGSTQPYHLQVQHR
jgi:hypothetical protein